MKIITVLAVSFLLALPALKAFELYDLRVENLTEPLGLDEDKPRFSWKMNDSRNGARQLAYRVIVASSEKILSKGKGDIWDSGKVDADQSHLVAYEGRALRSREKVFWKVQVWGDGSGQGVWSPQSSYRVGLLDQSDWTAQWIEPGDLNRAYPELTRYWSRLGAQASVSDALADTMAEVLERRVLPSYVLYKSFVLDTIPEEMIIYATSDGWYTVYVNGQRVGDEEFESTRVAPYSPAYYAAHDVTDLLKQGYNDVRVVLTRGWLSVGKPHDQKQMFRDLFLQERFVQKFFMQMEAVRNGQINQLVATDSSWKVATGQVLKEYQWFGEICDGNIDRIRSDLAEDSAEWTNAQVVDGYERPLKYRYFQPVRVTREVKPVRMFSPAKGVWIYDLGEMIAGTIAFRPAEQKADTKISFRYSQELQRDGLHMKPLEIWYPDGITIRAQGNTLSRMLHMGISLGGTTIPALRPTFYCPTDIYITSGKAGEVFDQTIRSYPFRYVEVIGHEGKPALDALTGRMIHTDMTHTGHFESSDPDFNKFHELSRKTELMNNQGFMADCWDREKWPWNGEVTPRSRIMLYYLDAAPLLRKTTEDNAWNTRHSGYASSFSVLEGLEEEILWAASIAQVPWEIYRFTGDDRPLLGTYDAIMLHLRHHFPDDERGNVIKSGLYGDWLWYGQSSDEGAAYWTRWAAERPDFSWGRRVSFAKPHSQREVVTTSAMFEVVSVALEAAGKLNNKADTQWLEQLKKDIHTQFNEKYYDPNVKSYGNHEDSGPWGTDIEDVTVLWSRIGLDGIDQALVDNVTAHLRRRDHMPLSGFMSIVQLYDMLSNNNLADDAYAIMDRNDLGGIRHQVELCPDALAESIYSSKDRRGIGPFGSLCHPTFTGQSRWFYYGLGGIRPDIEKPGFKHFYLAPQIPKAMKSAEVSLESPYGTIQSMWSRNEETVHYKFTVPANTTATVQLPQNMRIISEDGEVASISAGFKLDLKSKIWSKQFQSGTYLIKITN